MPMRKYIFRQKKFGKEVPESIITDIELARESRANSELKSMANMYDLRTKQNIPLISSRFFQQYFLAPFNKCKTSKELRDILTNLKHKMGAGKEKQLTSLQEFEQNVLRLGYHSCIARCSFAQINGINDGCIDSDSMLQFFNECKQLNLIDIETYNLMLNGYINEYQQSAENEEEYEKINNIWNEFQVFINEIDPERPRNTISETAYTQNYISKQNKQYSEIYSAYLSFLCQIGDQNSLIKAVEIFYNGMEQRYVVPNTDTQLLLMEIIGNESNSLAEVARIFRIIASYTVNSPSIDYYNKYLQILIKFGDIDECIKILRLLVFKKYWNYMSIPDAPMPNLQTFEYIFKSLRTAIEKQRMTQDVGARKAEFVLKQMKQLKIGTPHSVYVLLYEALGVAWWESLPWHLRLINRP